MKTYVEVRLNLRLTKHLTLHAVLARFCQENKGWIFPANESCDYEQNHEAPAGYAVCESVPGLELASVAIAKVHDKRHSTFYVPNIVPPSGTLTIDQYNSIALAFADSFRAWLRANSYDGKVEASNPNKTLNDIIPGDKTRRFFEEWLHRPAPVSHPSDIHALDCFICFLFRHPGKVNPSEIAAYLASDLHWKIEDVRFVETRIKTGLEILKLDRRF